MNNVNRSSSSNNFICEICGSSYSRAEFLRRHSRSAHQKEAGKTFHCTHCNKSFARSDVLSRHKRRCHPVKDGIISSGGSSTSNRSKLSESETSSPSDSEQFKSLPPLPSSSYNGQLTFPSLSSTPSSTSTFSIFDSIGDLLYYNQPQISSNEIQEVNEFNDQNNDNFYSFNNIISDNSSPYFDNYDNDNQNQSQSFDILQPEKKIRRIEYDNVMNGIGNHLNPSHDAISDKFYLPAERFAGPYSIDHWNLPPLNALSRLAASALQTTNVHLPLIHIPTFKLSETSVCVAFALCSTGGNSSKSLKPASQAFDYLTDAEILHKPGQSAAEQAGIVNEVVRHEKLAMIHGSLANKSSKTSQADLIGLIQALLVYYAPVILEEDSTKSIWDGIPGGFAFICEAMRNSSMLDTSSSWMNVEKPTLSYMGERSKASVYLAWKNWISDEQKRRTIFIIYLVDLFSSIITNKDPTIKAYEMNNVPLPANDKLWMAPNAQAWAKMIDNSHGNYTHGDMMNLIFSSHSDLEDYKYFGQELGPFARNCLMSSIVRGILEVGNENGGSFGSYWLPNLDSDGSILAFRKALNRWRRGFDFDMTCQTQQNVDLSPSQTNFYSYSPNTNRDMSSNSQSSLATNSTPSDSPPTSYETSPTKDYSSTFKNNNNNTLNVNIYNNNNNNNNNNHNNNNNNENYTKNEDQRLPFVSEPLPCFWFSHLVLNILSPQTSLFFNFMTPQQSSTDANVGRSGRQGLLDNLKKMDLRGMLTASRTFSRMQEGVN